MFGSSYTKGRGLSSDFRIQQRRRDEDRRNQIASHVKADSTVRAYADWENKTSKKIETTQVNRAFDTLRRADAENLDERRRKLAQLLSRDEIIYKAQLDALQPTVEDRRVEMENRALSLKQERESERRQFVQDQLSRKFRAECDDLRNEYQKIIITDMVGERDTQLLMKEKQRMRELEDKRYWDEMWEADRIAKGARDVEERERAQLMARETVLTLNEQVAARQLGHVEDRERNEAVMKTIRAGWTREQEEAERKERQRQEAKVSSRLELDRFNKYNRTRKEREAVQERERDVELIRNLMAKAQAAEDAEAAKRAAGAEDERLYREHLVALMKKDQEDEAELEALRAAERKKAEMQQDARWAREAEARAKLMSEVNATRQLQVAERLQQMQQAYEENLAQRDVLLSDMEKQKHTDREVDARRRAQRREYASALNDQQDMRAWQRIQDQEEKRLEALAAAEAERLYKLRIERERDAASRVQRSFNRQKLNFFD